MIKLGIDLGTNSIGWAVVDEAGINEKILDCGVTLFPEGVDIEKGVESSKAAKRTGFRLVRRQKYRRKLRKCATLQVLAQNGMCPVSIEEINNWLKKNTYPSNPDFVKWYKTDELINWEPYFLRKKCVEQIATPFEIGRALYHIAQRRGFLSNRKESTKEQEGLVKGNIDKLNEEKGEKTLGQYFYDLKQQGIKVRGNYTSRKEHYLQEFNKICEVQNIDESLKNELLKAIFFQRPLKSQKFLVGKCTLERHKPRCPISHFEFEEYRMWTFLNNVKVKRKITETDAVDFEPLTKEEIDQILPKFYRKSKPSFDFKDISTELKKKDKSHWEFNYIDETNVAGCPVSASLMEIFGENWKETKIDNYDIYDIWHVLFDFDDDEKLLDFAKNKLHLDDDMAAKFTRISLPQGYASLSLKAIRKILVFLREGYIYSYAVFLANIPTIIGKSQFEAHKTEIINKISQIIDARKYENNIVAITNECIKRVVTNQEQNLFFESWDTTIVEKVAIDLFGQRNWSNKTEESRQNIIQEITDKVNDALRCARGNKLKDILCPPYRIDQQIEDYLVSNFVRQNKANLYHPSDNEKTKDAIFVNGKKMLNSPVVSSIKNPVVMRALHQLRHLINYLIQNDKIDNNTRVNVELANEVNDKNMRMAIKDLQKENENENNKYRKELMENGITDPSVDDIRKYKLWEEQNRVCFYTGKKIEFTDLFGECPKFDFEHTIPRSLSWDNSLENLTLCESEYNRSIKKQQIPAELANYDEIKDRVYNCYKDKIYQLEKEIQNSRSKGSYASQEDKDKKIQKRNKAKLKLFYYKNKLKRFIITEVDGGFTHSQINDTRTITKFALGYLKTVFEYVQPVKGEWTAEFRKQWGLQEYDEEKNRTKQTHHVVDAITVACVNRGKYNLLNELARQNQDLRLKIKSPWENFASDVKEKVKFVFPKYENKEVAIKTTKRKMRDKRTGKEIKNENGEVIYIQGDTARGALHEATFYGKIMDPEDKSDNKQPKCVVKKTISSLIDKGKVKEADIEKIVDVRLRRIFVDNLENQIQTPNDIEKNGLLLPFTNQGRPVYVKKVRMFAHPKNPISLKSHRDVSKKEYKQQYYVVNESNYLLAIYRGFNNKGKEIRDFEIVTLLSAVKHKKNNEAFYPETKIKKGVELHHYKNLKIGQAVILLENGNEDAKSFDKQTLWNRYYMIRGLKYDGRIKLVHNISSEKWDENAKKKPLTEYAQSRLLTFNQINCLVEGTDFEIKPDGELIYK